MNFEDSLQGDELNFPDPELKDVVLGLELDIDYGRWKVLES